MNLSKRQQQFVDDMDAAGFDVDYTYSGRGMYGKTCPAVRINRNEYEDVIRATTVRNLQTDSLGLGMVVYCER